MDVISQYTKQQTVEDGLQVDISNLDIVKEAGFRVPVYLTSGAQKVLEVPAGLEGLQDYNGRLWDLLTMAKLEVKRMQAQDDWFGSFGTIFVDSDKKQKLIKFFIVFNESEGLTIMLPDEY